MPSAVQFIFKVAKGLVKGVLLDVARYALQEATKSVVRILTGVPREGWETTFSNSVITRIIELRDRFLTWVRSLGDDGSPGLAAVA